MEGGVIDWGDKIIKKTSGKSPQIFHGMSATYTTIVHARAIVVEIIFVACVMENMMHDLAPQRRHDSTVEQKKLVLSSRIPTMSPQGVKMDQSDLCPSLFVPKVGACIQESADPHECRDDHFMQSTQAADPGLIRNQYSPPSPRPEMYQVISLHSYVRDYNVVSDMDVTGDCDCHW